MVATTSTYSNHATNTQQNNARLENNYNRITNAAITGENKRETQNKGKNAYRRSSHRGGDAWTNVAVQEGSTHRQNCTGTIGSNMVNNDNKDEFERDLSNFLAQMRCNTTPYSTPTTYSTPEIDTSTEDAVSSKAVRPEEEKNKTNSKSNIRRNKSNNACVFRRHVNNNFKTRNKKFIDREISSCKIQCILQNCHKSTTVNNEISEYLRASKNKEYIVFLTEPGLGRRFGAGQRTPRALPCTNNTFFGKSTDKDIRACLVADPTQNMDLMPQFSSGDVVSVLWTSGIHNLTQNISSNKQGRQAHTKKGDSGVGSNLRNSHHLSAPTAGEQINDSRGRQSTVNAHTNNRCEQEPARKRPRKLINSRPPSSTGESTSTTPGTSYTGNRAGRSDGTGDRLGQHGTSVRTRPGQNHNDRERTVPIADAVGTTDLNGNNVEDIMRELDDDDSTDVEEGPDTADDAPVAPGADQVILCCVYWDGTHKEQLPKELVNVLEYSQENNIPILVCGDLNAHSEIWGSPTSDDRGKVIEDVIVAHDLCLLNEGNKTTYHRSNSDTIVDVCLATNTLAHRIEQWRVADYATFSDHSRIDFKFSKSKRNLRLGRNLRKAAWSRFDFEVDCFLREHPVPEEWDIDTIEGQTALLETAIKQGLDVVAPLTPRIIRDRSPINNPEVIRTERECHRLKGRMKRKGRTQSLWKQFKEARNIKKYTWQRVSNKKYRGYVSEIPDAKGAAKLIRSVKRDSFVPPTLLKADGQYTSTKQDTIELLMNTHFPGSLEAQPELEKQMEEIVRGDKPKRKVTPLKWITTDKVKRAIASFSDYKACGPDGIKPVILKHLSWEVLQRLTTLLTACIQFGYTPLSWRASRTVFIPKPSREDYTIPKSFRPISLTSFCFKTLERLVLWHLEQTTFRRKPIHVKQHAFRKGHSTEVALSQVADRIEKAIYNNKIALAAFLDIEGAFDNLDTNAAVKAMKEHGIDKIIIGWYEHYLRNRMSTVQYGDKTSQRKLTRGTPQGGVLSPILWNLAFDSLLKIFDKGTVEIFGYADDACLITTAHDPKLARRRIQEAMDKCTKWGDKQGLRFSPKKTVAVLFRKRETNIDPEGNLTMYGQEVEYSKSVRYLGVQFDEKLRWNEHFQKKLKNAKTLLFKMRNTLRITWGLQPKLLRWVYTGIVRPAITYGSIVWVHHINGKEQLKQLQKLHGTILRMMCPKRRSTPVAGIEMMFYVPPLELVIKGEAIKAHMRNIHMLPHDWPGVSKKGQVRHLQANWDLCEQFGVPDMEWDKEATKLRFDNNYFVEEDCYEKGLDVSWPGAIMVYTDGSKVEEKLTNDDENDDDAENNNKETETMEQLGCGFVVMRLNN